MYRVIISQYGRKQELSNLFRSEELANEWASSQGFKKWETVFRLCCFKCGKGMKDNVSLVPIDPQGKNRRWSCLDHIPKNVVISEDIKELCGLIDDKFNRI